MRELIPCYHDLGLRKQCWFQNEDMEIDFVFSFGGCDTHVVGSQFSSFGAHGLQLGQLV